MASFNSSDELVDDGVHANVNIFALRQIGSLALRAHIESHNDGIRSRSKQHVGFGDRADTGLNDLQLDLIG